MANSNNPTVANLKRAIEIAEQIEKLQAQLQALVGGSVTAPAAPKGAAEAKPASRRGGRRNLSPEARERIAAAQRARWAKVRGSKSSASSESNESPATAEAAAPKAKAGKGRKKRR